MLRIFNEKALEPDEVVFSIENTPIKLPASTWTYMINDNPFDPMLEIQLTASTGLSAWAGMLWPLLAVYLLFKNTRRKQKST